MKPRRVSEAFPSLCGSLCRSSFSRRSLTCSGGWRLLGNGRMKAYVTMIPKASWGTRPQDQRPITCLARCFGARRLMPRLFSVFFPQFLLAAPASLLVLPVHSSKTALIIPFPAAFGDSLRTVWAKVARFSGVVFGSPSLLCRTCVHVPVARWGGCALHVGRTSRNCKLARVKVHPAGERRPALRASEVLFAYL